ncbi:hypothetical protein BJX70DRAFT_362507 [Aspergillus crustosus]
MFKLITRKQNEEPRAKFDIGDEDISRRPLASWPPSWPPSWLCLPPTTQPTLLCFLICSSGLKALDYQNYALVPVIATTRDSQGISVTGHIP